MKFIHLHVKFRILRLDRGYKNKHCFKNNKKNILEKEFLIFFVEGVYLTHFALVMTLWVRSTSARLEIRISSSSLSGKESIAAAARLACLDASSFVLCIPWLFPRKSSAWEFSHGRLVSYSCIACTSRHRFKKWMQDKIDNNVWRLSSLDFL